MIQNNFFYISRSEYWHYLLQSADAHFLFEKNVPSEVRVDIFNKYMGCIIIETSSYCNRRCSYCPVNKMPREQSFMSEDLFEKIIYELRNIDYRQMIKLNLFNEPLADKKILKYVRRIKELLPISYIQINSNGDYLTKEYLDELCDAGIDEMLITQHMNPDEKYSDELAEYKLKQFLRRVDLPYVETSRKENHNITMDYIYRDTRLLCVTNNWSEDGVDRAGAIEKLSIQGRQWPCCLPFREMAMDVDGNMRLCCNFYVNEKPMASVVDKNLLDIYFSDEMVQARRELFDFGEKKEPCNSCSMYDYGQIETDNLRKKILRETK